MKKTALYTTLRRGAALALALVLAMPPVYAAAGERKLQTTDTLVEGLTYQNTITVNEDSRVESFSLERKRSSEAYPILLQASGTVYGGATINRAVSYAQELGYHVLAAVNTDFFSMASGVPIGIVIEDGVYKSSPEEESAMLITDGKVSLLEDPRVELTLTNQRSGQETHPHHLNKWRSGAGGLYLLNHDFSTVSTRTSTPGWYVRMRQLPKSLAEEGEEPDLEKLTVNSTLTLEVVELLQSEEAIPIGTDEYILTAADASGYSEVYQSFQVGDQVTLTSACDDPDLSAAQWAGGVGDVMVREGRVTDSSGWTYQKDGRNPRTALGVKRNGDLIVYTVDGRQPGYSMGLSQQDLAEEMLARGCQWAVNLDGGGSAALSLWVPGREGPALESSPSEGKPRSCATYLLFVTDDAGDGEPDRLALKEDGLVVLAGSSLPLPEAAVLDSGLNLIELRDPLEDLEISSGGLGTIADGIYTAGVRPGTDNLALYSRSLRTRGTAQIHVVDRLTSLSISREGESTPTSAMSVKPNESVQLAVTGSYWGRAALRDFGGVEWTVTEGLGQMDENGLFTASGLGVTGTITASAGGLTQTIQIVPAWVHTDVEEGHWAYQAVEFCYEHGIVSGISGTEFGRDQSIRRGDFVLMLYSAMGRPAPAADSSFTDVYDSDYYYTALSWAQGAGLASGTGDGAYSPNSPITREQAFTILRQAMPLLGKQCPDGSLSVLEQFPDQDQIAGYARGHAATLVSQGIVSGRDAGIDPRGSLTRAEMAVMLRKIMTYTPITDPSGTEDPNPSGGTEEPVEYTLTLNQSQAVLDSGDSVSLSAVLSPAVEGAEILWTSSDPGAAVVSPTGVVTNLFPGEGSVQVSITASWYDLSATCVVECQPPIQTGTVTGAESGLNIRTGPGTDHPVAGSLANGERVVVLGGQDNWHQILYRNSEGQAALGYVSGDYLKLTVEEVG